MISYAQNAEDVILRRAFPRKKGFYVDIGAGDPIKDSVTKHFYNLGWRGINIEPQPNLFKSLIEDRPKDTNLDCAVTKKPGKINLVLVPDQWGLATIDKNTERTLKSKKYKTEILAVDGFTLTEILQTYAKRRTIDFLKIDVEGAEKDVLQSLDFNQWRPTVIVIEATYPETQKPSHHQWESILTTANYKCALFDGLNRYYCLANNKKLLKLLSTPANSFDRYVPYRWLTLIPNKIQDKIIAERKARGDNVEILEQYKKQRESMSRAE